MDPDGAGGKRRMEDETRNFAPRWEWRCFAPRLAPLAARAGLPAGTKARESDERYLLDRSGRITDTVKIRDGRLDVKRLLRTGAEGLESWAPVLKAAFPLGRETVAAAFGPLLPRGGPLRESYTLDELIGAIPALLVVDVHKSRRGFAFRECLAELAELTCGEARLESFALEHEDPARVLAALRALGLDPGANTSYGPGLRGVLGLEPPHLAASSPTVRPGKPAASK
jgi:exopolyphosphatase/guanosine-5'-triphosphate,3'-diphosphate pyrophosphatase